MTAADLGKVRGIIKQMNHDAKIIETNYCSIDIKEVIGTKLYNADKSKQAPGVLIVGCRLVTISGWMKSLEGELVPETVEYGVNSFVYKRRRPFHPVRYELSLLLLNMIATGSIRCGNHRWHCKRASPLEIHTAMERRMKEKENKKRKQRRKRKRQRRKRKKKKKKFL